MNQPLASTTPPADDDEQTLPVAPVRPRKIGQWDKGGIEVQATLRAPILAGSLIVAVLVVGLIAWMAIFQISGAVLVPGVVRVQNNSKAVQRLDGGIVREILVHEGQLVREGQVVMRFDNTQSESTVAVYQASADNAMAQIARFQAQMTGAPSISFPPELLNRAKDPQVAALISSQQGLFASQMTLYRSQAAILRSQIQQLNAQIIGIQSQIDATGTQSDLIDEELKGVRELSDQGYAPRSRLLALQRSASQLRGQRGAQLAQVAQARKAIGQSEIELAQLTEKLATEAAEGLRTAQAQLTDTLPKLRVVQDQLAQTEVRAPATGHVFNLTQFTEGGVAAAGTKLMEIVPVGTPLLISTHVKPTDITDVRVGQTARITLTAYNPRTTPPIEGKVFLVGADVTVDERSGEGYYVVQIQIPPEELRKAGPKVHLAPGMPAAVAIVTGNRTILDYLIGPFVESMEASMRDR